MEQLIPKSALGGQRRTVSSHVTTGTDILKAYPEGLLKIENRR